jgi:phosphosulfolactate synthase (CoM biosynthesis protein A)
MGPRYLSDVLETMGDHVDGPKFAGGRFSLFTQPQLSELIGLAHEHDVYVSTGGWMEHILSSSGVDVGGAVDNCRARCSVSMSEISTGSLSLPGEDWLRLVDRVQKAGMIAKPELGIQFGAGGDTGASWKRWRARSDQTHQNGT